MRSPLLFAALATAAMPLAANAVDVKLYGNVSKAAMGYDDGIDNEFTVVDDNNLSTRIGVAGEQKLDNGLTASVLLEAQSQSNGSQSITQNTVTGQSHTPVNTTGTLEERMARVGLSSEHGALFIGNQDIATDDVLVHDLAAAGSMVNSQIAAFGGGLQFRTSAGTAVNVAGTDLTPNDFALGNNGDLASANSVRFNTATYNGFNGSLSASQGGNMDAIIRYANSFGDFQIDTALGHTFVNDQTTTGSDELTGATSGSASVKHSSGLGATVAYTTQHLSNKSAGVDEAEGYYGKVGYAWGAYGVAAEYGKFKNPVASATKQEMDVYGIGADRDLGNGVSVGGLYRNLSADVDGISNIEDINVYTVSMRVKF
ncbi:MAG: porin [Blastochloris viridis]|uniref:Porin n=1 Tax=Blastochloris viridis TaxID=1079 RepID=A0A6N4RBJ2_BLAVI|nr:MAG: porin [Blastochloris viridis]